MLLKVIFKWILSVLCEENEKQKNVFFKHNIVYKTTYIFVTDLPGKCFHPLPHLK